jgi:hypothetical protein
MVRANGLNSVAQQLVYVNGQTGSDTAGNGSAMNPYATITKANAVILDNATGKRYTILHTGSSSEANLTIKPWTSIVGDSVSGSQITITGTGNLGPDATWDNVVSGVASIANVQFSGGSGIDFQVQAFGGSGATLYISNVLCTGSMFFQGRNTDAVNLSNVTSTGGIVTSDFSGKSNSSYYLSGSQFAQSSSSGAITWQSNNDYFSGTLAVQRSTQNMTASVFASSIQGAVTVTGSGASFKYDAVSLPLGGVTLASSGTATALTVFTPTQYALFTFQNTSTNWTTNGDITSGWGNLNNTVTPTNGDYLDWAVPGTITPGIYKVEYPLLNNADIAIVDFSYKANGAGGYTNLRTGIDGYANATGPYTIFYTDYFQITTAGTLNLRWTVNGKNASGTAFIVFLGITGTASMPGIKVTRIE